MSFFKDDFMFTITNKYLINLLHSIENITGKIQTYLINTPIKEKIYYDQNCCV